MATPCCHTFLAFNLKFLNFLQAFIGISIIVYSFYMLDQWNKDSVLPPSPAPAPSPDGLFSGFNAARVSHGVDSLNLAANVVSTFDDDGLKLRSLHLPAPWFIYAFMGLGIVLCCITCIGHIAAEAINGFCLCVYTLLKVVLILLEAALVAFIALDHKWEKDLPYDPTGQLDNLRAFIENNIDICKWVGIIVLTMQALSLLIAMVLRIMVSAQRADDDIEGDYDVRGNASDPLLNPQLSQASGSIKSDGKGVHSDIWSSRIRDKYGLNGRDVRQN